MRRSLIAAAALLASLGVARAQPTPAAPGATALRVGALQLWALRDADFSPPNDGKTFGVDVGPAAVAQVLRAAGKPTDKVTVAVDALLVKAPGRVILLDTGLGPSARGAVMGSLAQAGVSPDQVTDVLITHTHGDHVGGLATADGRSAFPKAVIRMSQREWAYMQGQPGAQKLAAVIKPQVRTFEPGAEVAPGIAAVAFDGHTPGHVGYEVVSGQARLLDIGDVAHSSLVSLQKPDWAMGFDSDKAVGRATRRAELTRLSQTHELIFAPHFPYPGVGRVERDGDGFVWRPALR